MIWTNWLARLKVEEQEGDSMKYLASLGRCWPNIIIPSWLIKASEDTELWKRVIADVVFDDMAP